MNSQSMGSNCSADDIDDCVHRTDFMEVNALHRHVVNASFCLTKKFEGANRGFARWFRNVDLANNVTNGGE